MGRATLENRPTFADVRAGSRLGAYELLLPIAQGGMATVWAARLVGPGKFQKLVALKAIHRSLRLDSRIERMFTAEAKLAASITHANVCSIRELGEADGCLFIAMEWIEGDTLAALEAELPDGLPIALATRVAVDVALGLSAAHQLRDEHDRRLGLVHCDVSPQNILVTLDGTTKVIDFGLVRSATASVPDGELLGGKMSFMAPEQADGMADSRTDVFALGIVLYRLITGRHPFGGETSLERFRAMHERTAAPAVPSELRPECPVALSRAILRAIQKKPAARFQSMVAFARALRDAVPETESAACREELAALARSCLGPAVRERRSAIENAVRSADARRAPERPSWPAPEPEPVSLPSSVLEEIEVPRALETQRPVAFSAPPPARPTRAWALGLGVTLLATVTLLAMRPVPAPEPTPEAVPESAATAPQAEASLGDLPPIGARVLPEMTRAIAAEPPEPAVAIPASTPPRRAPRSAPRDPEAWRLEPGF